MQFLILFFVFCSGCGFRVMTVVVLCSASACRRRRSAAVRRAASSACSSAARARSSHSAPWPSRWTSKPKKTFTRPPGSAWPLPKRRARKTGIYIRLLFSFSLSLLSSRQTLKFHSLSIPFTLLCVRVCVHSSFLFFGYSIRLFSLSLSLFFVVVLSSSSSFPLLLLLLLLSLISLQYLIALDNNPREHKLQPQGLWARPLQGKGGPWDGWCVCVALLPLDLRNKQCYMHAHTHHTIWVLLETTGTSTLRIVACVAYKQLKTGLLLVSLFTYLYLYIYPSDLLYLSIHPSLSLSLSGLLLYFVFSRKHFSLFLSYLCVYYIFFLTRDVDGGFLFRISFYTTSFPSLWIGLVEGASEALTSTKRRSSMHTPFSAPSQLRACSIPYQRTKTKRE